MELTKDPKAIIASEEMLNGQLVLRIALADTMQSQGCVDCLNSHPLSPKTDWQLSDVRCVLEVTKSLENVYINARETRINIIVSMLFIIVLVMFTLHILFKKIVLQRTEKLNLSLVELSSGKGDLTARLDVGENDQIGDLALHFNELMDKFRSIVSNIVTTADIVEKSIEDIKQTTTHIAQTLNKQNSETQQITENIHLVTSSLKNISQNTDEAAKHTKATDKEIKQSTLDMQASVEDIKSLSNNMAETANVVSELS